MLHPLFLVWLRLFEIVTFLIPTAHLPLFVQSEHCRNLIQCSVDEDNRQRSEFFLTTLNKILIYNQRSRSENFFIISTFQFPRTHALCGRHLIRILEYPEYNLPCKTMRWNSYIPQRDEQVLRFGIRHDVQSAKRLFINSAEVEENIHQLLYNWRRHAILGLVNNYFRYSAQANFQVSRLPRIRNPGNRRKLMKTKNLKCKVTDVSRCIQVGWRLHDRLVFMLFVFLPLSRWRFSWGPGHGPLDVHSSPPSSLPKDHIPCSRSHISLNAWHAMVHG